MKENTRKQEGFIQIPLLIIIVASAVVFSVVGTGVVLYRQEQRQPAPVEAEERSQEIEELEQKVRELERKQPIPSQQSGVKIFSPSTPPPAKLNIEKEVEELKLQRQQQLKIEQCKATAQSQVDKFKRQLSEMYLQGLEALKNWERAIVDSQISYSQCIMEPVPQDLIGAPPDLQAQYRESKCSYYLDRKAQLERELEQERMKLDTLVQTAEKMGEAEYSRLYLNCLNQ